MNLLKTHTRAVGIAARFLGVILWIYIVSSLDLSRVFVAAQRIHWTWIILTVLAVSVNIVLKAARWNLLLANVDARLKFRDAVGTVITSAFWSSVTPGRIGELYRFRPFVGHPERLLKALVSVVVDRSYDVALLVIWTLVGLMSFSNLLPLQEARFYVLVLTAGSGIVCIIVLLWGRIVGLVETVSLKVFPKSLLSDNRFSATTFRSHLSLCFRRRRVRALIISFLAFFSSFIGVYWLALGMGVHAPFLYLSVCYTLSALVSLIPISFGGLGTREAVFIYYLGRIDISAESALLLSFTQTVAFYILLPAVFAVLFPAVLRVGRALFAGATD